MSLTFGDVKDRLKMIDEVSLLEVLDITAEDIVDRFQDKIEQNLSSLQEELSWESELDE